MPRLLFFIKQINVNTSNTKSPILVHPPLTGFFLVWVFKIPPRRDFAFRSTRNDWGTSCPCFLPPTALKSKQTALRLVVDSTTFWQNMSRGCRKMQSRPSILRFSTLNLIILQLFGPFLYAFQVPDANADRYLGFGTPIAVI